MVAVPDDVRVNASPAFERYLAVIVNPALRAVALHWHAARRDRIMPGWRGIDPAALKPQLPILWSWKYDRADDSFTGRLAGEDIITLFGRSLRGQKMEEFFARDVFERLFIRHKRVVSEPALYHGIGLVFRHEGRRGLGERIILPLADDGRTGDSILGATVYEFARAATDGSPTDGAVDETETFFPLMSP